MLPSSFPCGLWCSVMEKVRRAFSSYWWVMESLCKGPLLEGWEVCFAYKGADYFLLSLVLTLPRLCSSPAGEV